MLLKGIHSWRLLRQKKLTRGISYLPTIQHPFEVIKVLKNENYNWSSHVAAVAASPESYSHTDWDSDAWQPAHIYNSCSICDHCLQLQNLPSSKVNGEASRKLQVVIYLTCLTTTCDSLNNCSQNWQLHDTALNKCVT